MSVLGLVILLPEDHLNRSSSAHQVTKAALHELKNEHFAQIVLRGIERAFPHLIKYYERI